MHSKAKIVVVGLTLALAAVIATAIYRSQIAPGLVVERILGYWRPGYHNIVDKDWLPEVDYEPLYRVSEYDVLKIKIRKNSASVLTRVKYQTGHRQARDEIYTFVLRKTRAGWKAERYYKGFGAPQHKATSLQDILQGSSAAPTN